MISAATGIATNTTFNGTNISGTHLIYVNITECAADCYIGNLTFKFQYYNGTQVNLSTNNNNTANDSVFSYSWDTTAFTAEKNGTLNLTAYNYNTGINSTNSTQDITVDNTAPVIAVYSGATLTAYANTSIKTNTTLTGSTFPNNLTLNISVTDATIGMTNASTAFCIVNVNNGLNHSVPLTSNRWCNSSNINITGLSDGNSTIRIWINDTLNTLANSTLIVHVDTTAPIASAVCSPSSINTGDTFPCTCSTSDATSGINSASSGGTSSSPNGVVTPSSTGVFTYTCSATDNGGLTASATATYTVNQPPSSGTSGGTTGTTTWTTHTVTESVFEQGYTKELGANNRIKVQIDAEDHFISVVSISATQATIQISSNPVQVTLAAGEEAKVDVNDDGFYDVYVLLNGITNNKADVTIQKLHEEIPEGEGAVTTNGEIEGEEAEEEEVTAGGMSTWIWILVAVVVLVIAVVIWQKTKAKKK